MRRVAIIGTGTLPWRSRYTDKTARALALEATQRALQDAGMTKEQIDATVYSIYCDTMIVQQHPSMVKQDYIGMGGRPSLRITAGAATGLYALYEAFIQIASGMSNVLLLLAVQKGQDFYSFATGSRGDGLLKGFAISGDVLWSVCTNDLRFWVPHLQKYGSPTPEQVAKFSVMCHRNALVNPDAQLKLDITVEDVLNSRITSWPSTMLEFCLYSDCAAALILASEDKAKEICDNPVWITGISLCHFLPRYEPETIGRMMGVHIAGKKAYEMAGIKDPLEELDVLEVHDIRSCLGVLMCEELGLCELGESGRLVDEGALEKDGKCPVNPSGGRVACGHVGGVSDIYSAATVVRQLQERAGLIQVRVNSGKGLVEAHDGYGGLSGVAILER